MSSVERVIYFNPGNNGDLHVSRELVRYSMARILEKHAGMRFAYCHRNPPEILRDIDGLDYVDPVALESVVDQTHDVFKYMDDGKTLALNTWYAKSPVWGRNGDGFGLTLNTLVELFRAHLRHFDLKMEESVERFIPKMAWDKFHTLYADSKMDAEEHAWRKRVLFCNGPVRSGQSHVSDDTVTALLGLLSSALPDVLFIFTHDDSRINYRPQRNVVFSGDLIGAPPWGTCDLNETAFIGSLCDVVVGRCSGPHSFCYNTDVLLDATKTMVCLNNDERCARWVYMSNAVKATIHWVPATDLETLRAAIAGVLV